MTGGRSQSAIRSQGLWQCGGHSTGCFLQILIHCGPKVWHCATLRERCGLELGSARRVHDVAHVILRLGPYCWFLQETFQVFRAIWTAGRFAIWCSHTDYAQFRLPPCPVRSESKRLQRGIFMRVHESFRDLRTVYHHASAKRSGPLMEVDRIMKPSASDQRQRCPSERDSWPVRDSCQVFNPVRCNLLRLISITPATGFDCESPRLISPF